MLPHQAKSHTGVGVAFLFFGHKKHCLQRVIQTYFPSCRQSLWLNSLVIWFTIFLNILFISQTFAIVFYVLLLWCIFLTPCHNTAYKTKIAQDKSSHPIFPVATARTNGNTGIAKNTMRTKSPPNTFIYFPFFQIAISRLSSQYSYSTPSALKTASSGL